MPMLFDYPFQEAIAMVERVDATFQDVYTAPDKLKSGDAHFQDFYAAPDKLKMLTLFSLHVKNVQEAIAMVERGDATVPDVDAASDQLKMLTLDLNANAL